MRFVTFDQAAEHLRGLTVAVVGSAPSVLDNAPGFIDSHEAIVRVNNYKLGSAQGFRVDVHYSFYGSSIRKSAEQLRCDGVDLCMCKCPDDKPLQSAWHEANNKQNGIDFRYIYKARREWWFCDTYIPSNSVFMQKVKLLGAHIPSTGFAAILDVLACAPRNVYLTGFDFFTSGVHNVDEAWNERNTTDPIRHVPERELAWLSEHRAEHPLHLDAALNRMIA